MKAWLPVERSVDAVVCEEEKGRGEYIEDGTGGGKLTERGGG